MSAESQRYVRLAATADLHCTRGGQGSLQPLFARVADEADVLLLCGDLTDNGLPEEAHILVQELATVRIPMIGVLGNHDFESNQQNEVQRICADGGIHVLDGNSFETLDIGFAGVKGFAGGFGRGSLGPWGEEAIKLFVHESIAEALKLESALARLRTAVRIALLHYAPIRQTIEGEPPEIFPFLGSSRLEEPLNHYNVAAVFHGHAHHGSPQGNTSAGIPVYNVSMRLLLRNSENRQAYRIVQIPTTRSASGIGEMVDIQRISNMSP